MNCTLCFATKRKDKKYKGRTTKVPIKYPDKRKAMVAMKESTIPENIFGASGCFMSEFFMLSTLLEYHKNRKNTSFFYDLSLRLCYNEPSLFKEEKPMTEITTTKDYMLMFNDIKKDIQTSRVRAALSVNKELTMLYWRIGKSILEKQKELGWGSKVIEQLSQDLKHTFPDMKGFSIRNLKYMQAFCLAYMEFDFTQEAPAEIVQQLAAQIPWGHNQVILDKLKELELRKWYIEKTIENGWSRNVLVMQIESGAHLRLGKAQTNFKETLPKTSSDLAQQLMKNEYNFDFLGLGEDALEKDIEKGLMAHIQKFLLEIGTGFAFLGSQYKLNVGGDDFYIDMLFYHTRLRCYFVIELKAGKFQPEYTGKLGFYVTAVNRQLKHESDQPTIGILLCKQANKLVVEYALQENKQPMGVASYTSGLPDEYQKLIPSKEQFQHLLDTLPEDEKDLK